MPKLFRYRRPSLSTMLGVTKAKKRINKALGITAVLKPFRAPSNAVRRMKRAIGYYSEPMKMARAVSSKNKRKQTNSSNSVATTQDAQVQPQKRGCFRISRKSLWLLVTIFIFSCCVLPAIAPTNKTVLPTVARDTLNVTAAAMKSNASASPQPSKLPVTATYINTKLSALATNTRRPINVILATNTPQSSTMGTANAIGAITATPVIIIVTATHTQAAPTTIVVIVTSSKPILRVTNEKLNIRSGPSINFALINIMQKGDTATIVGRNQDRSWWLIEFNGLRGWTIANVDYSEVVGDIQSVVLAPIPPSPVPIIVNNPISSGSGATSSNTGGGASPAAGICPRNPQPHDCAEAVAWGMSAQEAALCDGTDKNGKSYPLDQDGDGEACYYN